MPSSRVRISRCPRPSPCSATESLPSLPSTTPPAPPRVRPPNRCRQCKVRPRLPADGRDLRGRDDQQAVVSEFLVECRGKVGAGLQELVHKGGTAGWRGGRPAAQPGG